MTGPSERAVAAAGAELERHDLSGLTAGRAAVEAAYPIIRADVIAEVVDILRPLSLSNRVRVGAYPDAAAFIERELGGG